MKRYMLIVAWLVVCACSAVFLSPLYGEKPWHSIVYTTGGTFVAPDEAGRPCAYYKVDNQLLCFNVWQTWYGENAAPAYVIEDNKRIAL